MARGAEAFAGQCGDRVGAGEVAARESGPPRGGADIVRSARAPAGFERSELSAGREPAVAAGTGARNSASGEGAAARSGESADPGGSGSGLFADRSGGEGDHELRSGGRRRSGGRSVLLA